MACPITQNSHNQLTIDVLLSSSKCCIKAKGLLEVTCSDERDKSGDFFETVQGTDVLVTDDLYEVID